MVMSLTRIDRKLSPVYAAIVLLVGLAAIAVLVARSISSDDEPVTAPTASAEPAATQPTATDLVGTWRTTVATRAAGFTISGTDTYRPDGSDESLSNTTIVVGKPYFDSETSLHLIVQSSGTWKLDGDDLIERTSSSKVVGATTEDEVKLHSSQELEQRIRYFQAGPVTRMHITRLTGSTITLSSVPGFESLLATVNLTRVEAAAGGLTRR